MTRTREDIEKDVSRSLSASHPYLDVHLLTLEVLLDIREVLYHREKAYPEGEGSCPR